MRTDSALVALSEYSKRRHEYFAVSPVSFAGCQLTPLSIEISTLAISFSPAQAKPATATGPAGNVAPSAGWVISDFTTSPLSGAVSFGSTAAPGATRLVG